MEIEITKEELKALKTIANDVIRPPLHELKVLKGLIQKASPKLIFTNVVGEEFFEGDQLNSVAFDFETMQYVDISGGLIDFYGQSIMKAKEGRTCVFKSKESLKAWMKRNLSKDVYNTKVIIKTGLDVGKSWYKHWIGAPKTFKVQEENHDYWKTRDNLIIPKAICDVVA